MDSTILAISAMTKLAQATVGTAQERIQKWNNRPKQTAPGNYDIGGETIVADSGAINAARDAASKRQDQAKRNAEALRNTSAFTPNVPNAPLTDGSYGMPMNPALYRPYSPMWNRTMAGRSLDLGNDTIQSRHPLSSLDEWENFEANAEDLGTGQDEINEAYRAGVAPILNYGDLINQAWNQRGGNQSFSLPLPRYGGQSPFNYGI